MNRTILSLRARTESPLQNVHHKFPTTTSSLSNMRFTTLVLFLTTSLALLSREETTDNFCSCR
jgi:hypothetical protein